MNSYRACHYNKLLQVHRQKGQVYYFPLRHSDGWSKWLYEVGEFRTFFEYVLDFGPFCTMRVFLLSVPFSAGEKMESGGEGRGGDGGEAGRKVSECFSTALIHLCQQLVSTFHCTKMRPVSLLIHPVIRLLGSLSSLWSNITARKQPHGPDQNSHDESFPRNLVIPPG